MIGPRDAPGGIPYAVNPLTGEPLQDVQIMRLKKLREVSFLARSVLHEVDGSSFVAEIGPNFEVDDHYGSRDLAVAATKLDEAILWASKAVLGGK
jgi:hypothetical protein